MTTEQYRSKMAYQKEYRRLRKLNGGRSLGRQRKALLEEGKGLPPEEFSKHLMCLRCSEIGCIKEEAYCTSCWTWLQNYNPPG